MIQENRKKEIWAEAQKRIKLWLENSSFDQMTVHGSMMRFDMALGLNGGYPFEKEEWMKEEDFNDFITDEEFYDPDYDNMIHELFAFQMFKNKKSMSNNPTISDSKIFRK
jgi:hypothetical protein